jgi:phosphopantetheinyl transferase
VPRSPRHSIDLWLVSLDSADAPSAADLPDAVDRQRCEQIVLPSRQRQFSFRRRALRYVLGRYLPRYSLEVAAGGKPWVSVSGVRAGLHFSTSASKDVCAVSVCRTATSGVDIEAIPSGVDLSELLSLVVPPAARRASPAEFAAGAGDRAVEPMSFRQHLAVLSWCRIEAFTKLHGRTLHEVLFEQPEVLVQAALAREGYHVAAVANLDCVCVVAQRQPFRVAKLHQIDFARIAREQA